MIFIAALLFTAALPAGIIKAEERIAVPAVSDMEPAVSPLFENEFNKLKTMQLEAVKTIGYEFLRRKKLQKLRDTVASVKAQRQAMEDFAGFFRWMSTNLAGYNHYIQASSYVAAVARILPVPYAGQASNFTKFVSQFTVALNNASRSATQYMNSSQKFITLVEAVNPALPLNDKVLAEAHLFADRILLKDMNATEKDMAAIADLSSGTLSFLTALNQLSNETANYWNKVKGLVKKDVDPQEKSYLSASVSNLRSQAEHFNKRFTVFKELTQKETAEVKSLVVYDELAAEIGTIK